jgi:hypothetical protein
MTSRINLNLAFCIASNHQTLSFHVISASNKHTDLPSKHQTAIQATPVNVRCKANPFSGYPLVDANMREPWQRAPHADHDCFYNSSAVRLENMLFCHLKHT